MVTSNKVSIASLVQTVLEVNPCMIDSIEKGYANYTRLASIIAEIIKNRYGVKCSIDATKMALLRSKNKVSQGSRLRKIYEIFANSNIEVKTGLSVLTYDTTVLRDITNVIQELSGKTRFLSVVQSVSNITIIINKELCEQVKKSIKATPLLEVNDTSALILISPPENVEVPGFIAYLTAVLAIQGVNIIQIVSSHSDTIVIVGKQDTAKTFNILEKLIENSKSMIKNARNIT
ncbi:MAG: ACT domain-containing protein [Desulfurococcaceae archaeon]